MSEMKPSIDFSYEIAVELANVFSREQIVLLEGFRIETRPYDNKFRLVLNNGETYLVKVERETRGVE